MDGETQPTVRTDCNQVSNVNITTSQNFLEGIEEADTQSHASWLENELILQPYKLDLHDI